MKVLWFTDMMMPELCASLGLNAQVNGGWMPSLADAVREFAPEIELHIASEGPVMMDTEVKGIRYHLLGGARPSRVRRLLTPFRREFICAVSSLVDRIKPDLIHLHGSEGLFPTLPKDCWHGVPIAISLQGIISGYAAHYMGNLTERQLSPYRNYSREFLQGYSISRGARHWSEKRGPNEAKAIKSADYIYGRTRWDYAWTKFINPQATYMEVGEILRKPFFLGKRDGRLIRRHSIYCGAAVTYPLKGAHWLIEAVAHLREKYPDVKLVVARGDGLPWHFSKLGRLRQQQYHRYLSAVLDRFDLWRSVDLKESLTAEQVRIELEQAEVFCLPSLIENSPNSLGEAMLTGTPSVATYVGGVPSILENGKEGLLVPSGDAAALADAIDCYFSDPEFANACAVKAYATAVKRYDPKTVVAQLREAYRKVSA